MAQAEQISDEIIDQAIEKATEKPVPESKSESKQAIVFYCKICKEIVSAEKKGKSLSFVCPKCSQSKIAIGTQSSIESYYHLNK